MATTLSNGFVRYGDSTTQNTREQCKVWARLNSNGSILDSYNVSSSSKLQTGSYRVNYNTQFQTSNYCSLVGASFFGAKQSIPMSNGLYTTYMNMNNPYIPSNTGYTWYDSDYFTISCFGDQ